MCAISLTDRLGRAVTSDGKPHRATRFDRVLEILDEAVGGLTAPVSPPHGPFWRGLTRDQFVVKKVLGFPLVSLGDGAGSNLVKALRGQTPFGADIGNPDADYNRMPSMLPAVPADDIAFIEKWIDEGCPEDLLSAGGPLTWRKTNAPLASSRTDDIWFVDPQVGWAVNSDGKIIKTSDGGTSWTVQETIPQVYLRCVGFANANVGWVGTLSPARRLFHTVDGGAHWNRVTNLPPLAPVAVCGISVVSDQVVYASGTNRPNDFPRMIRTLDGGATWIAWDMSPHASILIDCYFRNPLHGWVVGGKADEPTPTTRDRLKPVMLETTDGGVTWTNRLDGQEDEFPFGEWGWKIQFLDEHVGFVSLENFAAAAILKTEDGGLSWTRLPVNDAQGNVNLEGIGFIDARRGWVGGWGPGGFGSGGDPQGFSSGTSDGGQTWTDANEIGLFINRFRFFGQPVTIGYASGDTVYKYTSDPLPALAALAAHPDAERALLPNVQITGPVDGVPIRMHVPEGTKRLSLLAWDRFGQELGTILDEMRPAPGPRTWRWDGTDGKGQAVAPGDYLLRMIADDLTVSSRVKLLEPPPRKKAGRAVAAAPRPQFQTLTELVEAPLHDLDWLREALQVAVELELATLPPYLTARWTIKSPGDAVSRTIKQITREEMLHLGLACNLLTAIGGTPVIADEAVVPEYPGPLPWGIRPGLIVSLRLLDRDQAQVFMEVEHPQHDPLAFAGGAGPATIGEFYAAILEAFRALNPPLSVERQLQGPLDLFVIDTLAAVEQAIWLISVQGEGSTTSPEESPGMLAHYYEFGEIFHGRRLIKVGNRYEYAGTEVPLPEVYNMADVPEGGYQRPDVPDMAVWDMVERFDRAYSELLRLLEQAWALGDAALLWASLETMGTLQMTGRDLIATPRPDGQGNYGPSFRYVASS